MTLRSWMIVALCLFAGQAWADEDDGVMQIVDDERAA